MNTILDTFFKDQIDKAKYDLRENTRTINKLSDEQRALKKRIKYLNMVRKQAEKDAEINELMKRKPKEKKSAL